jgi:hypothetical protein
MIKIRSGSVSESQGGVRETCALKLGNLIESITTGVGRVSEGTSQLDADITRENEGWI